ncbi:MAG: ATP-dependent DNA helicase RecQ [Prevotella sp.]|jgi:ATP-dependent DNA helicase RecQ|nr:ATP-dependent DNA helicase RecQ [Prevotella sp.]
MTDDFLHILKQYWGYDSFRGIQLSIIESIASGRDTLGLMPTGGGKSITFQVPAIAKEGTCIVVTPLIALMKDQVEHLRRKGVKAAAIYSGMTRGEIVKTLDNCILGGTKLLYVSPERLSSELFLAKLHYLKVSFITVDEAHCISQWGYDFRPAYLQIADLRKVKPDAPVLALTATATPEVADDIQQQLHFREKNVFRMSFERKNLAYVVRATENKVEELVHILSKVPGSAIVYVRSRRKCKKIAEELEQLHIAATYYHAGLEHALRDERQRQWQNDEKRVMVATNAFGMGIDKPNVRLVVHIDCPDSIEAYFQEAGRAGRDGLKAYAVLLWSNHDVSVLEKHVSASFPPKEYISHVYDCLAYYYQIGLGMGNGHTFTFDLGPFCSIYHLQSQYVESSLHLLDNAGYLHYETDPEAAARLHIILGRNELYRLNELSEREEAVIEMALRLYGGLFTDYQYIDESLIALRCKMTEDEVYQTLKSLSAQDIVHFIPQRKKPYITYLRDREETVYLSPSIYEDRQTQLINRVQAIINYATNNHVCRSRQLLHYFGEERSTDCRCCDVCLSSRRRDKQEAEATRQILNVLSDNKPHDLNDLKKTNLNVEDLGKAVEALIYEQQVYVQGTLVSLKPF